MINLKNKTAVVTGGSSGIGYATVKELKSLGAKVLFTGRNQEAISKTSKELDAIGFVSDQGKLSDIDKLVDKSKQELGKVDILFINAGTFTPTPFEKVTEEFYDDFIRVNQKGVFFTIQKFSHLLNNDASIILMSAGGTKSTGASGTSVYYQARSAVNAMVRNLCHELAPRGIRINAILPAAIETPIFNKAGVPEEVLPGLFNKLKEAIPLKRLGTPTDVARAVAFLASDNASFINGTEYVIDGGMARKEFNLNQ
jgi:NAD(P)-dependent dehydrogenase (short-subunit alcohol dehydrogenase family)